MNKYTVLIDVANSFADFDETPNIIEKIIEAKNAPEARDKVIEMIEDGKLDDEINGREYYVWEVHEEDKVLF